MKIINQKIKSKNRLKPNTMKRINLFAIALLICAAAIAQKKPKIRKVENHLKDGELTEAKAIVDAGIEHPKTKDDEKTWFMRALTYVSIDTTESFAGDREGAMKKAVEAFDKAAEMSGDKEPYLYEEGASLPTTLSQFKNKYYQFYFNKAAAAYESGEYPVAVENFDQASNILPSDTIAYVYGGYAAQNAEDFDAAREFYEKALEYGATQKDIFSLLIYLLDSKFNEKEEALKVLRKAKEQYPEDAELAKSEVNLLISMDKKEEAKDNILKTIENEPDNPNLYFTLGVLYDELEQPEKALEAYDSAIEIDPDHYNSNYNKGVLLVQQANKIIKEDANLGMSKEDQKKSEELRPKIQEILKKALPQWKKLYEMDSRDKQTLETLRYIHSRLGNDKETERFNNELEALGEG